MYINAELMLASINLCQKEFCFELTTNYENLMELMFFCVLYTEIWSLFVPFLQPVTKACLKELNNLKKISHANQHKSTANQAESTALPPKV